MTKNKIGISFKTDGRTVSIDINEKLIRKAGNITVFLDEDNTAHFSLSDWTIGRKRRFHIFKRKDCGVLIDNSSSSIIIEGKSKQKVFIKKDISYELWKNWSENHKDILVCTSTSKLNIETIKIALEKIKGVNNYYIKEKE